MDVSEQLITVSANRASRLKALAALAATLIATGVILSIVVLRVAESGGGAGPAAAIPPVAAGATHSRDYQPPLPSMYVVNDASAAAAVRQILGGFEDSGLLQVRYSVVVAPGDTTVGGPTADLGGVLGGVTGVQVIDLRK